MMPRRFFMPGLIDIQRTGHDFPAHAGNGPGPAHKSPELAFPFEISLLRHLADGPRDRDAADPVFAHDLFFGIETVADLEIAALKLLFECVLQLQLFGVRIGHFYHYHYITLI